MTRRERMEARLEKRLEWAEGRKADADRRFNTAREIGSHIPLGQPILVGHHSEGRHRRAIERIQNNAHKGCESLDMAKHHESKASGIEAQLESSIYSDDPDAIEALEAKALALEAKRDEAKVAAAWWRKAGKPNSADTAAWLKLGELIGLERANKYRHDCASEEGFCNRGPVPSYVLSNLGATIRQARQRIEVVKRRNVDAAKTEAAGGFRIARDYRGQACAVQFSEKPERAIIDALKAARFIWHGGRWVGTIANLPACVLALDPSASPAVEGVPTAPEVDRG